jgi:hypothetical protein
MVAHSPRDPAHEEPEDGASIVDPARKVHSSILAQYLIRDGKLHLGRTLTPRAALAEVLAVCESAQAGIGPPRLQDRQSLKSDVKHSLISLGGQLKRGLQPTLHDYLRGELTSLEKLLDDRGGITRLAGTSSTLLGRLTAPSAAQAAWRDFVADVSNGKSSDRCELRLLQLKEIVEGLGHDWEGRRERLRGMAKSGNFEACEELLSLAPDQSAQVVWFIFTNADLPSGYQRIGQVQFFSDMLFQRAAKSETALADHEDAEVPYELGDPVLKVLRPSADGASHVYARVELHGRRADDGRNPWAARRDPAAWARDLVSAIVDAATFRIGGSSWKLLTGSFVYHGPIQNDDPLSNWSGNPEFSDPDAGSGVELLSPEHQKTGFALEELPPGFGERLAEHNAASAEAISEVRWYQATRRQTDAAQRVVLHVRAFERALPMTGRERWNEAVRRYFRESWALDRLNTSLVELAHRTEFSIRLFDPAALRRERLEWVVHDEDPIVPGVSIFVDTFLRQIKRMRIWFRSISIWRSGRSLMSDDGPVIPGRRGNTSASWSKSSMSCSNERSANETPSYMESRQSRLLFRPSIASSPAWLASSSLGGSRARAPERILSRRLNVNAIDRAGYCGV